jgi:quercetin dioxygenase-like cupin family protein
MGNIALLLPLVGSSIMAGLGLATYLLTVPKGKVPFWISLALSVILLTGSYFFFSAQDLPWFIFMAWFWLTGVLLGFILIVFIGPDDGDDEEETEN